MSRSGGLVLVSKINTIILMMLILLPGEVFSQVESRLEVIKVEQRSNELINRQDFDNYDSNGNLAAGLIIQSNVPDLTFRSFNGILRVEQTENEWKLLVSENERLITVFSNNYLPAEIILNDIGVELVPGSFWLIQVAGVSTGPMLTGKGNFQINTNPEGADLSIEGFPDLNISTPFLFEDYLAQTYSVTASKTDYESVTFPMSILSGQTQEQIIELTPLFGHINFNVEDLSGNQINSPEYSITSEIELVEPHIKVDFETLPVGENKVIVSAIGFRPKLLDVTIEPFDERVIDVQLDSSFSYVSFEVLGTNGRSISGTNLVIENQYRIPELEQNDGRYALQEGSVVVNASRTGYQNQSYTISVSAGKNEVRELILLTDDEAELIPSDVKLMSDNNVFINAFGRSSRDSLTADQVVPGSYLVEISHPYKSFDQEIFIRPDEEQSFYFPVLPSRSQTIAKGLVPGLGHITTKRPRGWAYLGLTVAAYAYSFIQYNAYVEKQDELAVKINQYQNNTDEGAFTQLRSELLNIESDRDKLYNLHQNALLIGFSLHLGSFTDISFSRPEFGFR